MAGGRHEWACFAAHPAAEKAVKAVHLRSGQDAWGRVVARLLQELPDSARPQDDLIERARVLDAHYIPTRYPNGHPAGSPFEHYAPCRAAPRWSMPVRSSNSRVLRWPDEDEVLGALVRWTELVRRTMPGVRAIGYFGSYARGDWGPGSDLDVVVVSDVVDADPFSRAARFDTTAMPVPVDLLVYTPAEFERLSSEATGLGRVIRSECRWL